MDNHFLPMGSLNESLTNEYDKVTANDALNNWAPFCHILYEVCMSPGSFGNSNVIYSF